MQRFLDSLARALFAFGLLVILFTLHQVYATDLAQAWEQRSLKAAFEKLTAGPAGPQLPVLVPEPLEEGESVGILRIPKIGLEQAVIEGVEVSDLKRGPGHYPETPLPGRPGNAALAGHRTTYGAPFMRLDELVAGDRIDVTTREGAFRYDVTQVAVVSPAQTEVLAPSDENRLTLTTCHPRFSAAQRLIVTASLASTPVAVTAEPETEGPGELAGERAGLSGLSQSRLPTVFWGMACLLAFEGLSRLARRWPPKLVGALGAIPLLALLWLFFENVARVLPANI